MVPEKPAHMYLSYNEAMLLFKDVQKRIIASQSADSEYSKNKEAHEAEVRMIKARSRSKAPTIKVNNSNSIAGSILNDSGRDSCLQVAVNQN